MYTQCKVRNRLTLSGLHRMIPDVEEAVEDTEAEEEVEEDLAVVEGRSSAITMDSKATSHGTIRCLPTPIVNPSITLLKSAWCC